MGCVNSTKSTNTTNARFDVIRIQPTPASGGIMELNQRELVFIGSSRDPAPVVWALQHLRRYGVNGNVFSFEAGRRCASGPGIYSFRCRNAGKLYQLFQRYINNVVTDEIFNFGEHPSHTFGPHTNPHTNNYLEPAPMISSTLRAALRESFSNSPISLDLETDSAPSPSLTNEQPSTPGTYVNTIINANNNGTTHYPLRSQSEHNNNTALSNSVGGGSAFSTLSRKLTTKRSSLDIPPEERAPILLSGISESMHLYANVEGLGSNSTKDREREREKVLDPAERCYENLSRVDLPLLLQPPPPTQRDTKPEQSTPPINYIVLDLDQPRSPAQISPKTCFGSGFSLTGDQLDLTDSLNADVQSLPSVPMIMSISETTAQEDTISQQDKSESSLGYSTIDFIKTCALIKSSTHCADFDPDHDNEESRITRHSKCVRKAYSISE